MSIKAIRFTPTLIAEYEDGSYLERTHTHRFRIIYHEGNGKHRVGEVFPADGATQAKDRARALRAGLVMNCL